jgi:hypothetical protein
VNPTLSDVNAARAKCNLPPLGEAKAAKPRQPKGRVTHGKEFGNWIKRAVYNCIAIVDDTITTYGTRTRTNKGMVKRDAVHAPEGVWNLRRLVLRTPHSGETGRREILFSQMRRNGEDRSGECQLGRFPISDVRSVWKAVFGSSPEVL